MINDYPAYYEDGYDAIKTMIERSGKDYTQCAYFLMENGFWPSLSHEVLTSKFRACMNPHKDTYFKKSEIIALQGFCGRCDPLFYECDILGRVRPELIPEQVELADITRQLQSLLVEVQQVIQHVERVVARREPEKPAKKQESMPFVGRRETWVKYSIEHKQGRIAHE